MLLLDVIQELQQQSRDTHISVVDCTDKVRKID